MKLQTLVIFLHRLGKFNDVRYPTRSFIYVLVYGTWCKNFKIVRGKRQAMQYFPCFVEE